MEQKKSLNRSLKGLHKHCSIEALAKMTGITRITLYEINRNQDHNLSINNVDKIYKATKLYYGRGIAPWEYLNISNYSTGELAENNLADKKNIPMINLTN